MADTSCELSLSQRDSYCRRSTSRVLSCAAAADGNFSVVLDDSCLYPEGGGQPCDGGSVGGVAVIRVDKIPGQAGVSVTLAAPLETGSEVECAVDWPKRYDAMQQHTAQHLLSAIAGRVARVDTVKWEFFPDSVVVDFVPRLNEGDAGQPLPPLQSLINEVEESTNEAIRAAAAVSWRLVAKDDLDQYPQARGEVKGAALEMQHLRLVFIEGIDANPCGGTHLRSTAEIQALKIVACEKDRGATRLRFISGHRLLQHLASSMARDRELNVLLNCGPDAFVSSVDRLQKERKDLAKDHKSASDELATFFGRSLAAALSPPTVSPKAVIYHHRPHSTLAFLSAAAEAALAQRPDALVILAGDDLPVPPAPKKAGAAAPPDPHRKAGVAVEGPFVVYASDASVVVRATAALLPAIGGRGGGRPNRYQGQATNVLAAADVAKEL